MIIDSVKKRKSGTITINYTDGGKQYGLILTPHEIVENYLNRQTKRAADGLVCTYFECNNIAVFNGYCEAHKHVYYAIDDDV